MAQLDLFFRKYARIDQAGRVLDDNSKVDPHKNVAYQVDPERNASNTLHNGSWCLWLPHSGNG